MRPIKSGFNACVIASLAAMFAALPTPADEPRNAGSPGDSGTESKAQGTTMKLSEGAKWLLDPHNAEVSPSDFEPPEGQLLLPYHWKNSKKDYAQGVFYALLDEEGVGVVYTTKPNPDPNFPHDPSVQSAFFISGGNLSLYKDSKTGKTLGDFKVDASLIPADNKVLYERGLATSEKFHTGLKSISTPFLTLRGKFNNQAQNFEDLWSLGEVAPVSEKDGDLHVYPYKDATFPLDARKIDTSNTTRVILLSDISIDERAGYIRADGHVVTDPKIILFIFGQEAIGITNYVARLGIDGPKYKIIQVLALEENDVPEIGDKGNFGYGTVAHYVLAR